MTISLRAVLRIALIGVIALTQIAATAKKVPWPVPWNLYSHPQRLVDVSGRRMNIICYGKGTPTVILDAGLGAGAFAWRVVQPQIARHTRVCSYDRAGMGFSDPAGPPRDAAAVVSDSHSLLRSAGIAPPYVLVGWSSAGLYTLLYADRYPNEVVGLVEVDPTTPYEDAELPKIEPKYTQLARSQNTQLEGCAVNVARGTPGKCPLFHVAEFRKQLRAGGCPNVAPAACAAYGVMVEHETRASYWRDEALESKALTKSMAEVRAAQRPYADLPLIVLTDSEQGDIDRGEPLSVAQQRAIWLATEKLQEREARLSSVGEHFVVAGSTHAIQLDQPTAVISAVDEAVDEARYGVHRKRP